MRWQPVFRSAFRRRGRALKPKIDVESAYRRWMFSLLGKRRAFELHEQLRAERLEALPAPTDPSTVGETDYPRLTAAEVAVAEEASYGYTEAESAEHLHKSPETVRRQIKTGTERMGARNVSHLIALAIRSGQVLTQQRPKGLRARRKILAAMSMEELDAERSEQVERRGTRRVRDAE